MKKEVIVNMADSTGATPIAKLVQLANSYDSSIYLIKENIKVNAKSIMGMMSLVITPGTTITLDVSGDDENEAITAVEGFLSNIEQ